MPNNNEQKGNFEEVMKTDFVKQIRNNSENNNWYVKNIVKDYDENTTESVTIPNIIKKEGMDYAMYYMLSEALTTCDSISKEKGSREMSLVKTKIQEAIFWLNECK